MGSVLKRCVVTSAVMIALLVISSRADSFSTGQLLTNPGAETGNMSGWSTSGTQARLGSASGGYPANSGSYLFFGGTSADALATQDVALIADGRTANRIDNGDATIYAYFSGRSFSDGDEFRVRIQFLNGSGSLMSTAWDTGYISDYTSNGAYDTFQNSSAVPIGARTVRYTMFQHRLGGTNNDGYIDDNSLELDYTNNIYWKTASSGTFFDDSKWTPISPTSADCAVLNQAGSYTVSLSSGASLYGLTVNGGTLAISSAGSLSISHTNLIGSDLSQSSALLVTDGGRINNSISTSVGYAGRAGRLTVSGVNAATSSPSTVSGGGLAVGNRLAYDFHFGQGTMTLADGGQYTTTGSAFIGYYGGIGTVNVSGVNAVSHAASSLSCTGYISVGEGISFGYSGDGTLTLNDGGQATSAYTQVGAHAGKGVINVGKADGTDAGGTQFSTAALYVSPSSSGVAGAGGIVNIYPGGTLRVTGGIYTYANTAAPDITKVNLNGGTIQAQFLSLASAAHLNFTSGTLQLMGGSSTINGTLFVPASGALTGVGTINGDVYSSGLISPGDSIGSVSISGKTAAGNLVHMQIASPTSYDHLSSGTLAFVNAMIEIELDSFTPSPGETFNLFDFVQPLEGAWRYDFSQAPLPSWMAWDTSHFLDAGEIGVIAVPEPAGLSLLTLASLALLRRRRVSVICATPHPRNPRRQRSCGKIRPF